MVTRGYGRKGLRGQFLWHFDFAATGMEGRSISLPLDRHIAVISLLAPWDSQNLRIALVDKFLYHFMSLCDVFSDEKIGFSTLSPGEPRILGTHVHHSNLNSF